MWISPLPQLNNIMSVYTFKLCLDNLKLTEWNGMEQIFHSIIWIFYDEMEIISHSIVRKVICYNFLIPILPFISKQSIR